MGVDDLAGEPASRGPVRLSDDPGDCLRRRGASGFGTDSDRPRAAQPECEAILGRATLLAGVVPARQLGGLNALSMPGRGHFRQFRPPDDVPHGERRSADLGARASAAADHGRGKLIRLCADLERCQAEIDRLTSNGAAADELDVALDAWWSTVESITTERAKTTRGVRVKARAVRTVMVALGSDRSPAATALLASLLADLTGEAVDLP